MFTAILILSAIFITTMVVFFYPTEKRKEMKRIRNIIKKAKSITLHDKNKLNENKHQVEHNRLNIVIEDSEDPKDTISQHIIIEHEDTMVFNATIYFYVNNNYHYFDYDYSALPLSVMDIHLYSSGNWELKL